MRVLLDTHAWLWMQSEPHRLGGALSTIADEDNDLLLSVASSWEIAIKYATGRLPLPDSPATYVPDRLMRSATTTLPIDLSHALRVATLPLVHSDPFDRLLIAQAQALGVPVVTGDPMFERYDIEVIAAG